jgi:hypothetical protein
MIIKWIILGTMFALFMAWFVGGYIHAKARLRKGLPLLGYHRVRPLLLLSDSSYTNASQQFLISYSERKRHGQAPQNHFTFYAQEHPYYPNQAPYAQRPGPHAEPPPLYNNSDAPPQYFAPPGPAKVNHSQGQGVEMPMYAAPQGQQQSGVVGGADVEQGQSQQLPPRPQQAKAVLKGVLGRFKR